MNCWLCERSGFAPGEIKQNIFGDWECIYCESRLSLTVQLLIRPELIPLMAEIGKLPRVDGVQIGIQIDGGEE